MGRELLRRPKKHYFLQLKDKFDNFIHRITLVTAREDQEALRQDVDDLTSKRIWARIAKNQD